MKISEVFTGDPFMYGKIEYYAGRNFCRVDNGGPLLRECFIDDSSVYIQADLCVDKQKISISLLKLRDKFTFIGQTCICEYLGRLSINQQYCYTTDNSYFVNVCDDIDVYRA